MLSFFTPNIQVFYAFFVGQYTCMMYQEIVFLSVQKPYILNLDTFVLHSHVLHTCRNARVICILSNEICACVFHPQILTSISITLISSNKPLVIFLCYLLNPNGNLFHIYAAIIKVKGLTAISNVFKAHYLYT